MIREGAGQEQGRNRAEQSINMAELGRSRVGAWKQEGRCAAGAEAGTGKEQEQGRSRARAKQDSSKNI